jgi:hypothetical protein
MGKDTPRLLIQHRFKTHADCHEKVDQLLEVLPAGEYLVLAKVNRTYFEFESCALYLPRAVSLTESEYKYHQRNKTC